MNYCVSQHDCCGLVNALTRHHSDNFGYISPQSSNAAIDAGGIWGNASITASSALAGGLDLYGVYFRVFGNTSARIETRQSYNIHAMEVNPIARFKVSLTDETAAARDFFGFTSIFGAGSVTADDPAGTRAGLSYLGSSGNWAFTSKNNGGAEERTDTGIAADTDPVECLVELQGWATEQVQFTLFNYNGEVISSALHNTAGGVPSGSNGMQFVLAHELNVANGGVGFRLYGAGGGNRCLIA